MQRHTHRSWKRKFTSARMYSGSAASSTAAASPSRTHAHVGREDMNARRGGAACGMWSVGCGGAALQDSPPVLHAPGGTCRTHRLRRWYGWAHRRLPRACLTLGGSLSGPDLEWALSGVRQGNGQGYGPGVGCGRGVGLEWGVAGVCARVWAWSGVWQEGGEGWR
eukprot:137783-Chlamydomonas_euryale.AAC.3